MNIVNKYLVEILGEGGFEMLVAVNAEHGVEFEVERGYKFDLIGYLRISAANRQVIVNPTAALQNKYAERKESQR